MSKTRKTVKFDIDVREDETKDKEKVKALVLKALDEGYEFLEKDTEMVISVKNPNYSG